jgi:hypothetical protein
MQRVWFFSVFFVGLIFPLAVSWPQEDYKSMLPEADGKQLVVELCGTCHNLQKVVTSRKSDKEWERSVYDMVSRGAQIFPEEADQITKYLAKNFPPGKATN